MHLHDTYFVVAHFHYVMVGGTSGRLSLAGSFHWWPKMFGKMFSEARWPSSRQLLVFIGFNMTFLPQFVLGKSRNATAIRHL